jgi:hypothetical protein
MDWTPSIMFTHAASFSLTIARASADPTSLEGQVTKQMTISIESPFALRSIKPGYMIPGYMIPGYMIPLSLPLCISN